MTPHMKWTIAGVIVGFILLFIVPWEIALALIVLAIAGSGGRSASPPPDPAAEPPPHPRGRHRRARRPGEPWPVARAGMTARRPELH